MIDTPADIGATLLKYNSYYRSLSAANKRQFSIRLQHVLAQLTFTHNDLTAVSREMQVLITSALIQITFGLNNYVLTRFKSIIVVSANYNFEKHKNLLGHVDVQAKRIVFSWPGVKNGFIIPDDAINVALHEMAHVLYEENKFRSPRDAIFDKKKYSKWSSLAEEEMKLMRINKYSFFKEYGSQNMLEMFAVSIETFFENGQEFERQLPDLYYALVDLLRQDPLIDDFGMSNFG